MIIAIIPARGGSKSILGKNIRQLADKPLLAHTIESALQSKKINRLIVSTDDKAIYDVAIKYGAEVVIRPADISGDTDSSESALLHALEALHDQEGYQPDILVFLQCTSPLTLPEDIDGTVQVLLDHDADTAFAATPFHYFIWSKNVDGSMSSINHDAKNRSMRQQRHDQFIESGAVYVMRVQGFLEHKHRFFGKIAMYELPKERCFEIDEPVDLLIAEQLIQRQKMII
ncbi:MAG: acylneuraminate cytidylyltransferase family protein [Candidatus Electronema sp. VV]